ncbi:MAG: hypothetical protein M0Q48_10625 [Verrucomicrobia bacterium]|nr:hypothetical protein [Verrucomicrobiota bacterium]
MKTILASSLVIAILTLNLTSTWLGGFGLSAWVVGAFAALFIGGVAQAMADYKRLSRR